MSTFFMLDGQGTPSDAVRRMRRIYGLAIACLFAFGNAAAQAPQRPNPDAASLATFTRQVPCPSTRLSTGACPGFVVTQIRPPCLGGSNSPGNLQWQKVDATATARPVTEKCP